jgi:putative transposase
MKRLPYATDLTDKQWTIIQPFIPPGKPGGRPRTTVMREVVNAIFYVLRSGCAWRLLPHDFPPWQTVYRYFRAWIGCGLWETIHTTLRELLRRQVGREPTPSAGILDSQSVKITRRGGFRGYDGAKKVNGRKRHALVDTQGLLMKLVVSPADVRDPEGAEVLLERVQGRFPRLKHIWVDQGYRGQFIEMVKQKFRITVEVVKHAWSDMKRGVWLPADAPPPVIPSGFHVLPRRWVVERTFAWFGMYRRLSKDYEYYLWMSEGMAYAAMIHLMLRRLARNEPL